jgi:hypothetical protein
MQNNHFEDSVEHSSADLELMTGMQSMMSKVMKIELLVVSIAVADSVADRDFEVQD